MAPGPIRPAGTGLVGIIRHNLYRLYVALLPYFLKERSFLATYEYACGSCGHRFEAAQKFSDDPLTECERCGGPLRRVFQPVGVLFKGSGFYSTETRKAAAKSGDGKEAAVEKSKTEDKKAKAPSSPPPGAGSTGS